MFKELKDVFTDVLNLANNRRTYYEQHGFEGKDVEKKRLELVAYLNELDYEVVKTIQVIMYLGRDEDYDGYDIPEEIYRKQRKYFDSLGWNNKVIEINQIAEKMPLDIYLTNGFKILDIHLYNNSTVN